MSYGLVQTASNVAKQLREFNKDYEGRNVWEQLYGTVNSSRQRAIEQLDYDYSKELAEAYSASYRQQSLLNDSSLGSGFKQDYALDINSALQDAFNTYRRNYESGLNTIDENYSKMTASVDAALMSEAQNYVDYNASVYKYINNLYNQAYDKDGNVINSDLATMFTNDPNWNKYVIQGTDDVGNQTSRLMTEQELRRRNYDIDEQGNVTLNKTGADFYHQMMDELAQQGKGYGFYEWLAKDNSKLYEWSISQNPYNYTEGGSNAATYRTMLGLSSIPEQYSFVSNFGGMSEEELKSNVENVVNSVTSVVSSKDLSGDYKSTKEFVENYRKIPESLKSYINNLDITTEDKEAMINAVNNFETYLTDNASNMYIQDTQDVFLPWTSAANTFKEVAGNKPLDNISDTAMAGIMAIGDFIVTLGMEFAGPLADDTVSLVSLGTSERLYRKTRNDYVKSNIESNKRLASNVEQEYLDLLTYISSFADKK